MSWLEVPAGVEMPTTTTYERAVKRRKAKFDAWYESQYIEPTPQEKYNLAMQNYWNTKEHNEKVNKRRAKRGLEPLPMPEKPNKRDYMTEEGGNK